MGCFSFLCKKTGRGVQSTSFSGEPVHLFLLKNGKILEYMFGNYNSYGQVFKNKLTESFEWKMEWGEVCDLMFSKDKSNGIAAILASHFVEGEIPTTRSEDDPNQGWGANDEDFGSTSSDKYKIVKKPFHKIY